VYVTDASRAVGVATTLLSKELKPAYVKDIRDEYAMIRERTANRARRTERLSYEQALAAKPQFDWSQYRPVQPSFTGRRILEDIDLNVLEQYIDWTPFFISWNLAGKYPRILEDEVVGEAATSLFNDAQTLLRKLIDEKQIRGLVVFDEWPANHVDDIDSQLSHDDRSSFLRLHHLRQRTTTTDGNPKFALADFVAPTGSGLPDCVGGFIT